MQAIDLKQPVEVLGADKEVIRDGKGNILTLHSISLLALRSVIDADKNASRDEKIARWNLIKLIEKNDNIELTPPQKELLTNRISDVIVDAQIVGRALELIG